MQTDHRVLRIKFFTQTAQWFSGVMKVLGLRAFKVHRGVKGLLVPRVYRAAMDLKVSLVRKGLLVRKVLQVRKVLRADKAFRVAPELRGLLVQALRVLKVLKVFKVCKEPMALDRKAPLVRRVRRDTKAVKVLLET